MVIAQFSYDFIDVLRFFIRSLMIFLHLPENWLLQFTELRLVSGQIELLNCWNFKQKWHLQIQSLGISYSLALEQCIHDDKQNLTSLLFIFFWHCDYAILWRMIKSQQHRYIFTYYTHTHIFSSFFFTSIYTHMNLSDLNQFQFKFQLGIREKEKKRIKVKGKI